MTTFRISELWQRLESLENERRFDGQSYPSGMTQFPFRLKGQGFFPGGDGFWRAEGELAATKDEHRPKGGLMFLGNDFGMFRTFEKCKRKGFENVPTWRHLKERIRLAGIDPELTFFTNAILGLRTEGTALTKRSWQQMPHFSEMCGEFLKFQIETTNPRLVVVLGPDAKLAFDALVGLRNARHVLYTTHPYGDFNFAQERRSRIARELADKWMEA